MKIIRITSRKEEAAALNHELQHNKKDKCFILHFFMKGCIHCENLEPKMKNLEKHMSREPKYENVTLGKIDAEMMNDVNVENAYEFPTLKVVKNGETHQYKGVPDLHCPQYPGQAGALHRVGEGVLQVALRERAGIHALRGDGQG